MLALLSSLPLHSVALKNIPDKSLEYHSPPQSLLAEEPTCNGCLWKGLRFSTVLTLLSHFFPKLSQLVFHFLLLYIVPSLASYISLSTSYFSEIMFSFISLSSWRNFHSHFSFILMYFLNLPLLTATVVLLEKNYSVNEDSSLRISYLLRLTQWKDWGESSSFNSGVFWKDFLMAQCPLSRDGFCSPISTVHFMVSKPVWFEAKPWCSRIFWGITADNKPIIIRI